MAVISKELREMSQQPWFPIMMRELGYEPIKHGHWVHDGHHIRCSNCEVYFCVEDREGDSIPNSYCPNCGARMDEVEE